MELHISDEKTKELLSEVVVELLKKKKNLLYDVIIEYNSHRNIQKRKTASVYY